MDTEPKPQSQHKWLDRLVGNWTFEGECNMGPDQQAVNSTGTESVRSLGGLWTVGESECEMPGGGPGTTIMTLGYDPQSNRFVGSFVGSMMTHQWTYNGTLDAAEKVLTLDTVGPDFKTGAMVKYQDIIEFIDDDHRVLRSQTLLDDGTWKHFMTAHYRRAE